MKATQKNFASIAVRAANKARLFFFCGPDEAGASDAAETIVAHLADAGERVEITGASLRGDPVRLGDEARSTSLFGETRHLWVRVNGDEAHDGVTRLLAQDIQTCPVLIIASGATDKSRTAKLLADREDALVAMFYPPDLGAVTASVRASALSLGLVMGNDLAGRIAAGAALDMRLARSELTKLALYLDASAQQPRHVDAGALDAVSAKLGDDDFTPLVNTILGGDTKALTGELRRLRDMGMNPVAVLLACERRAALLVQLAGKLGPRGDVDALVIAEKMARRIFWSEEAAVKKQLHCWSRKRLAWLVDRLVTLHRALLSDSQNAPLLLAQGLGEIIRVAAGPTR